MAKWVDKTRTERERDRMMMEKGGYLGWGGREMGRHQFVCTTNSAKLVPALSCRCHPLNHRLRLAHLLTLWLDWRSTSAQDTMKQPRNFHNWRTVGHISIKKLFFWFCTMTNKCTIISQIITLLHVFYNIVSYSGACNQYLAKLHKYLKCSCW